MTLNPATCIYVRPSFEMQDEVTERIGVYEKSVNFMVVEP